LSLVSLGFATPALLEFSILAGFLPPLFFIIGTILCTPKVLSLLLRSLRTTAQRQELLSLSLAIGHIQSTLRRNAVSIAAVAATLGMVLGITVMIHSFRGTVKTWIHSVTQADIYISTTGSPSRDGGALSPLLLAFAKSLPEVADIDVLHTQKTTFNEAPLEIRGTRFPVLVKYRRLPLTTGTIPEHLSEHSNAVFISEAFMRKQSLTVGDSLDLETPGGMQQLTVQGVFEDYSSEHGILIVSETLFKQLFKTNDIQGVSLYLEDPSHAKVAKQALLEKFPDDTLTVRNRQELRAYVEEVFNQTFQITYVLQFVSTILAFFIVISTTIMLVLERFNELSMLFSIGAAKKQLAAIIAMESTLLGLFAVLFGLYIGAGLSLFLVFVVNVFFFGWLVAFSVPPLSILLLCTAVVVFAFLAGHLTARQFLDKTLLNQERYA
jgi:putative ABC transport system permease protein